MKLVDRYLAEIESRLPAKDRDDIIAELRATIEEHIIDYSSDSTDDAVDSDVTPGTEVGIEVDAEVKVSPVAVSPLTASVEQQMAILQAYGHPAKVAQSYSSHQYLIGPALYPSFVQTLQVLIIAALAFPFVIMLSIAPSSDSHFSLYNVAFQLLDTTILITGATVLLFVILERSNASLGNYENWRAEDLRRPAVALIDRSAVLTNLVTEGIFLLWWNDVIKFQNWLPMLGEEVQITLSETWAPFFWPLNILVGTAFALHVYVLIRGLWGQRSLLTEIIVNTLVVFIGGALILKGQLVNTTGLGEWSERLSINYSVEFIVFVIAAITLWDIYLAVTHYRKLL